MPDVPFMRHGGPWDTQVNPSPIHLDGDVFALAEAIMRIGYRYEFEAFAQGVTLLIVDTSNGRTSAIEVATDIPKDLKPAIERMVRRFAQKAGVV